MLLVAVIVFGVLVVLIAIPVTVKFDLNWHRTFRSEIVFSWMFGLVQAQVPRQRRKSRAKTSEEKEVKKLQSSGRKLSISNLVVQKRVRQRVLQYIGDLWRSIDKQNVRVGIRAGLDNPADTGQLWAILGPISAVFAATQQSVVNIEPDFIEPGLALTARGLIRFSPLKILVISIGVIFSPVIWDALRKQRVTP